MKIAIFESSETIRRFIFASVEGEMPIIWREYSDIDDDSRAALEHECFDAVVTSKELKSGGYKDVVRSIQCSDQNRENPIFLISSDTSNKLLNEAFDTGITDIFAKQDLVSLSETFTRMLMLSKCVAGAHVLIVEDDKAVSNYYTESLKRLDFIVSQASTCERAEEILSQRPIELVITDLNLEAGGQGQRVIRTIRRNEHISTGQIPIMVLSSSVMSQHQTGLFYLGIDEYIVKPVSPMQLALRTINLVRKYRSHLQAISLAKELKHVAHHDPLTRAYNRHGFKDIASFCIASLQRQESSVIGVMYIDLDNFKPVNDKHGHRSGDGVLRKVADLLKMELRDQDVVARWGGDEFIVLLNQCDENFVDVVSERIKKAMVKASADLLGVQCSIGLAHGVPTSLNALMLMIDKADEAMYQDKKARRDLGLR